MKKLMNKWQLESPRQVLIILFVFSITGSSSIAVGRPFLKWIGVNNEIMSPWLYYPVFVITSFVCYQLLLVTYGWLFGQFAFFWTMEKKMLRRFGLKI